MNIGTKIVVVLSIGLVAIALGSRTTSNSGATVAIAIERIDMPSSTVAGTAVNVQVLGPTGSSGNATIIARSGVATIEIGVVMVDGSGSVSLPAALTEKAGELAVFAPGGAHATLSIGAGPVEGIVTPLVGPRTIVADGIDRSMAVVIPVDRYGNSVSDDTPVEIEWTQPENRETTTSTRVSDGIAWTNIPAGVVAGPTTVGAFSSDIAGPRVRIVETPGRAASVEMKQPAGAPYADGRSIVRLETAPVFDAYGNELEDGTFGQFVVEGDAGRDLVQGVVQNGVLSSPWRVPTRPGTVSIHAELNGVVSDAVEVEFGRAVTDIPIHYRLADRDVVLVVGPLISNEGSFVADGTVVTWGAEQTQVRLGFAEFTVAWSMWPEELPPVSVLGVDTPVEDPK